MKLQKYVEEVFTSISKNIKEIQPGDAVSERFILLLREFYISLFESEVGCFRQKGMNKKLADASCVDKPTPETPRRSDANRPRAKKGLGKGSPGVPRKEIVSKRQERQREKKRKERNVTESPPAKRAATSSSRSATAAVCSTQPIDTSQEPPDSSITQPHASSGSSSTQRTKSPQSKEEHRPLTAQTNRGTKEKKLTLIRALCGAERELIPSGEELTHFWHEMDHWESLDSTMTTALKTVWNLTLPFLDKDETSLDDFLKRIVYLHGMVNGVRNCVEYFTGYMIRERILKNKQDTTDSESDERSDTTLLEELGDHLERLKYSEYVTCLGECDCEKCNAVLDFDKRYEEYHEAQSDDEIDDEEPIRFRDRPMHCDSTELFAHTLRTKYSGFGVTTLQNTVYFANSTGLFSPPTISTSSHTNVSDCTIRYMQAFLRDRKLQDPLPRSWKTEAMSIRPDELVAINKSDIHFYDGDSAEVRVSTHHADVLSKFVSKGKRNLRIRMLHHDAPETMFAIRIYKQAEDSTVMTHFMTRDIGVESLRAVRKIVFEARAIYLQVPKDYQDQPLVLTDVYDRKLMNIIVENNNSELENLAVMLASLGYTMSFYAEGIQRDVDRSMREAIVAKRGIFNLPEEVFTYPYRPWDLRYKWEKDREHYNEYVPISNVPVEPYEAWKAQMEKSHEQIEDSQPQDQFFFRIVESSKAREALCFQAKSTIDDAGNGLFLKRHDLIEKGTHLCLYADTTSSEQQMAASSSSRDYAICTQKKGLFFDAEIEDGYSLGRYANMPNVLEAFREIKGLSDKSQHHEITEADWKRAEDKILEHCDAEYHETQGTLIIRARCDIPETRRSNELFVSYGGLRTYWIPAILAQPERYPKALGDIVTWLSTSDDCNWSTAQREDWLNR